MKHNSVTSHLLTNSKNNHISDLRMDSVTINIRTLKSNRIGYFGTLEVKMFICSEKFVKFLHLLEFYSSSHKTDRPLKHLWSQIISDNFVRASIESKNFSEPKQIEIASRLAAKVIN